MICDLCTISNFLNYPVIISGFNFKKAAKYQKQEQPEEIISWEDDLPRSAKSKDGVFMVHSLPGIIKPASVVSTTQLKASISVDIVHRSTLQTS
jgi:hypothetical protein